MVFQPVTSETISFLQQLIGSEYVITDHTQLEKYAQDETEDHLFLPELIIKPRHPEEISQIVKWCNQHSIPITPRGAGTGLSGGALPIYKGIVLSMERFNDIIQIDELNLQATVEPGVITQTFQEAVKEKGLFYPPDPSSKGSCFIGGNVAENAGGPKAVKYGVTRDYVLNLEVVWPTGEISWTGANVLKNATGYSLTQLLIGSEGTLGIVTKIVFKLRPLPRHDVTLMVPFSSSEEACRAIAAIYKEGIVPSGMEFLERAAIEHTLIYLRDTLRKPVSIDLPDWVQAHLLIELDGNDPSILQAESEQVVSVLEKFNTGDILFAETTSQKEELWRLRRNVSLAVNAYTLTKAEDVVVPRGNLPELVKGIKNIGDKYNFNSVCYGHLGDGNLHINILKETISDLDWNDKVNDGITEIFKLVVNLGGTLSGEHGIGIAKKQFMSLALAPIQLHIMREIKKVIDPNGILNPGKIF